MTFRSDTAIVTVAAKSAGDMDSGSTGVPAGRSGSHDRQTLEWYDFLVYSFLSVTIAKLFFPAGASKPRCCCQSQPFGVGLPSGRLARSARHLRRPIRPQGGLTSRSF